MYEENIRLVGPSIRYEIKGIPYKSSVARASSTEEWPVVPPPVWMVIPRYSRALDAMVRVIRDKKTRRRAKAPGVGTLCSSKKGVSLTDLVVLFDMVRPIYACRAVAL